MPDKAKGWLGLEAHKGLHGWSKRESFPFSACVYININHPVSAGPVALLFPNCWPVLGHNTHFLPDYGLLCQPASNTHTQSYESGKKREKKKRAAVESQWSFLNFLTSYAIYLPIHLIQ